MPYQALHLTRSFFKSLERLTKRQPALAAQVDRVLDRYFTASESLERKPLESTSRKLFRTKIDKEKRLVDESLGAAFPNELAILYVDHHEEALKWGREYRRDTLQLLREGGVSTRRGARVAEPPTPAYAIAERKPAYGATLNRKLLQRAKVPAARHEAVLAAPAGSDLTALGLDEETAGRLTGTHFALSPVPRVALPVPGLAEAPALRVTAEQVAAVTRLPLNKLLATLTDEQRALARREGSAICVIKGAAGTGKTVIGVRRIEHLRQQLGLFDKPILFTCYNKVLANAVRQMIEDTLGCAPAEANVEVWTAYELLEQIRKDLGLTAPGSYVGAAKLLPLLRATRRSLGAAAAPLAAWSDQSLLDEILEMIYGRVLADEATYVNANRRGRGRPLHRERERPVVWKLYGAFRKAYEAKGWAPNDQLPARIAAHFAQHPASEPRYSAVIVDEAQDLLPSVFRALLGLQAGRQDNLMVLGDAAQNVYRSGFRFGHLGLTVAPAQVHTLKRSHRSTPNIIGAASPLIAGQARRLEGDLIVPEADGDAGPKVQLRTYASTDEELDDVANDIGTCLEQGWPASTIAVVLDDPVLRKRLRALLHETLGCPSEEFFKPKGERRIDIFEPSVKFLTVASAKGIEFQVLFVPNVTETAFPGRDDDGESADRARRMLYTAMTRSSWELRLSAPSKEASSLLAELDDEHMERHSSPTTHS